MKNKKRTFIGCSMLIIAVLLFHYGRVVLSKSNTPHLEWVIERGDEELLRDVRVAAQIGNGDANMNVQMSPTGTQGENHPLFHSYYTEQPVEIEYLQNRYPSFLRGKDRYPMNFAETMEQVFYVEDYNSYLEGGNPQQSISLTVSIFDKESNDEVERELVLEADSPIHYAYVQNMLATDSYLIFEMTLSKERNNSTMLYVYDWQKDEIVAEFNNDGDTMHYTELAIHGFDGGETEQFLVVETIYDDSTIHESFEWKPQIQRGFTLYDIQQNAAQILNLPEIFQHEAAQFITKNEEIYLILFEDGELQMAVYDVAKQETVFNQKIPIGPAYETEGTYFVVENVGDYLLFMESGTIKNGKIGFFMFDTNSLNVLVEGYIQGNFATEVFINQIYHE